jgi:hypothetical protein
MAKMVWGAALVALLVGGIATAYAGDDAGFSSEAKLVVSLSGPQTVPVNTPFDVVGSISISDSGKSRSASSSWDLKTPGQVKPVNNGTTKGSGYTPQAPAYTLSCAKAGVYTITLDATATAGKNLNLAGSASCTVTVTGSKK